MAMHVGLVRAGSALVLLAVVLGLAGGLLTLVMETFESASSLITVVAIVVVVLAAVGVGVNNRENAVNSYW